MKKVNKHRLNIMLTQKIWEEATKLAAELGMSLSVLAEQGLRAELAKHQGKALKATR